MLIFIGLALLNGALIGTSRSLNGRLALHHGAWRASVWNHLGGSLLVAALLWLYPEQAVVPASTTAPWLFTGGILGALFVALNSYVLPRLGALQTAMLVITGQMLAGVGLDLYGGHGQMPLLQLAGLVLIGGGFLARRPARQ